MSDNWTTGIRPGYRTKTIQCGSCTVTVHRPILSDEERDWREREVIGALESVMRSQMRKKVAPA